VTAILNFEHPTCLQTNVLLDKIGESPESIAANLVGQVVELIKNEAVVTDEYHTDQLLIFMALADGVSRL